MDSDTTADDRSLARTIGAATGPRDVLALLAVPAVLVLVFWLPTGLRRSLAFEYADPSLLSAFASAYVHLDVGHLLVNLTTYAIVAPLAYALSVASGHRRRFYTVFVTFLLAFPVVLSYLNLAIARPAVAYGFSGVTMAFVGYLPFALAAYLEERFDVGPGTAIAPALFFLTVAIIAALSVRSIVPENGTVLLGTIGLVAVAVLAALLYALAAYDRGEASLAKLRRASATPGYFELLVVGLVVVFAFPAVAFPADVTVGDGQLNLYAHLLGYALGFVVTFATVQMSGRLGRSAV